MPNRRRLALVISAVAAQGCFLFGGGEMGPTPDGGRLDAPALPCPPGLDFFGECDGTLLRYCDDSGLVETECHDDGLGIGSCFVLDAEFGNVCGTGPGEACFFVDDAGEGFAVYCRAPATGCLVNADGSACGDVGTCSDADLGTCSGGNAVVACQRTQPLLYDCASVGGSCESGAYCVGVPEGGPCEATYVTCEVGLSCVAGTCTSGSSVDGGPGPGTDAGPGTGCVWPGNLTIFGQSSLDAFRDSGCDEVEGDVVQNGASLTALRGLERLRRVGGLLELANCALTDLSALANLESVGDLEIVQCDALPSLAGLERLASTTRLTIFENDALTNIRGLRGLRSVGDAIGEDGILIGGNRSLTSLEGLEGITIANFLTVDDCPLLASLAGLRNLRTVNLLVELTRLGGATIGLASLARAGSLRLRDDDAATSIAFPALATVDSQFLMSSNDRLADFSFPSLLDVGGGLTVQLNPMLSQCLVDTFRADLVAAGFSGTVAFGGNLACP